MSNKLVLHGSAAQSAASNLSVEATAALSNSKLTLKYRIENPDGSTNVVWPALSSEARKDELWKTTCLEAFLLFSDGTYIELNFAPSGQWNAYRFNSYREGMRPESQIDGLNSFASFHDDKTYELSAVVDLSRAVKSPQNFRLGLTCVIETEGGERSYWSLIHPGEKPDFHDSRGHVLEMRI